MLQAMPLNQPQAPMPGVYNNPVSNLNFRLVVVIVVCAHTQSVDMTQHDSVLLLPLVRSRRALAWLPAATRHAHAHAHASWHRSPRSNAVRPVVNFRHAAWLLCHHAAHGADDSDSSDGTWRISCFSGQDTDRSFSKGQLRLNENAVRRQSSTSDDAERASAALIGAIASGIASSDAPDDAGSGHAPVLHSPEPWYANGFSIWHTS